MIKRPRHDVEISITNAADRKSNDDEDEDSVYDAADEHEDMDSNDNDVDTDDKETETETENDSSSPQPGPNASDSKLSEKFSKMIRSPHHHVDNSRIDDLRLTVQTTNATSVEDMYKAER